MTTWSKTLDGRKEREKIPPEKYLAKGRAHAGRNRSQALQVTMGERNDEYGDYQNPYHFIFV